MRKTIFAATCVALAALGATHAQADDDAAITGAAGGAVTGAIVGGPVGAAIGGAIGLTAGAAINPPPREVVTYVRERPAPVERVVVKERIVVGEPLPSTVMVERIPEHDDYAYAIVNDQRVIVDPGTNTVVEVID